MNELRNFFFQTHLVRVVLSDGEPRFVASDLARVLGYRDANSVIRNVDVDERGTSPVSTPGGIQEMSVVTESGLYSAVLSSRRKEAREFKRWITSEVLPSIRKTGSYSQVVPLQTAGAHDPVQALLTLSRTQMLKLALGIAEERDALKVQAQEAQATLAIIEPKAKALDRISAGQGSMCVTDAAKALRVKPGYLFSWMHEHRWIYRRQAGSTWVAMQDRLDMGFLEQPLLTISHPDRPDRVREHLKVTAKGLAHLGQLLSRAAS